MTISENNGNGSISGRREAQRENQSAMAREEKYPAKARQKKWRRRHQHQRNKSMASSGVKRNNGIGESSNRKAKAYVISGGGEISKKSKHGIISAKSMRGEEKRQRHGENLSSSRRRNGEENINEPEISAAAWRASAAAIVQHRIGKQSKAAGVACIENGISNNGGKHQQRNIIGEEARISINRNVAAAAAA